MENFPYNLEFIWNFETNSLDTIKVPSLNHLQQKVLFYLVHLNTCTVQDKMVNQ